MKNKVLVSFCSYNSPVFLETLVESFDKYDSGYEYDLLIIDHESNDKKQLKLLDKYSKKYKIVSRPNFGRAQGSYDFAWQNNKDYKYYFFMHDDSCIIRDNWLKLAVDRINENYIEKDIEQIEEIKSLPVGKVGYIASPWGTNYNYIKYNHRCIFHYIDPVANFLGIEIPKYYQHISDDKYLIRNELLQKMEKIWNIEMFKQIEHTQTYKNIDNFFETNYPNKTPFAPNDRYGPRYHAFQTVTEFLSDIAPMRYGYRTNCIIGDGYFQEEISWSRFWGHEYICHYGSHNLFKRLQLIFKESENKIRNMFKNRTHLLMFNKLIKKETQYVEK